MSKALGVEPEISLEELLRLSASNDWSVQFSPMLRGPGGSQGGTIIRSAAPWKGMKKTDNESLAEYVNRMEDVNAGVAAGLRRTEEIRQAVGGLTGETGVALIRRADGEVYPVPKSAAMLMEHQGTGDIVSEHTSLDRAISKMTSMTGEAPRFPTVY